MYARVLRRVIYTTSDYDRAERVAALADRVVQAKGSENVQSIVLEVGRDRTLRVIRATLMELV